MDKRFERIESDGFFGTNEVWVDTETGVLYWWHQSGHAGGLTVLVDAEGKPLVDKRYKRN